MRTCVRIEEPANSLARFSKQVLQKYDKEIIIDL
ncbi:hypothetical protein AWB68_06693 [Caballeronia choica]|jgi:hypothetical protein|uniref:Uncharacterized protein n=1 Tax=Caballeronia choica TaxID=326476 RepID=A0A158KR31_9BURK|nr:hypothetical protein AWB68_06693 [Caballeronia choica]